MSTVPARKAKFAPNPKRRSMIAKTEIARKQLNMHDDDFRQLLFDETGRFSRTECSDGELGKFLDALKAKGFQPIQTGRKQAQHPMARKARALWISLYQLNVVRNPDERALETFARRQLGVERLQWANQAHSDRLIEALKNMAERNGWSQVGLPAKPEFQTRVLMRRLCDAILAKLVEVGAAGENWTLEQAAWKLLGEQCADFPSVDDFRHLASGLGDKLREFGQ